MFGVKSNAWGHAVLTNVGSLGMTSAFAPITPQLHSVFLMCLGKVEKKAEVIEEAGKDDRIEIRQMCQAVVTFDHRYGDASMCKKVERVMRDYIQDPENFDLSKYPDNRPSYMQTDKKTQ